MPFLLSLFFFLLKNWNQINPKKKKKLDHHLQSSSCLVCNLLLPLLLFIHLAHSFALDWQSILQLPSNPGVCLLTSLLLFCSSSSSDRKPISTLIVSEVEVVESVWAVSLANDVIIRFIFVYRTLFIKACVNRYLDLGSHCSSVKREIWVRRKFSLVVG